MKSRNASQICYEFLERSVSIQVWPIQFVCTWIFKKLWTLFPNSCSWSELKANGLTWGSVCYGDGCWEQGCCWVPTAVSREREWARWQNLLSGFKITQANENKKAPTKSCRRTLWPWMCQMSLALISASNGYGDKKRCVDAYGSVHKVGSEGKGGGVRDSFRKTTLQGLLRWGRRGKNTALPLCTRMLCQLLKYRTSAARLCPSCCCPVGKNPQLD